MRLWIARILVATLAAVGLVAIPAGPALAKCPNCRCLWQLKAVWNGGYQAQVTVTNLAPPAYDRWTVTWNFQDNSAITGSWDAIITTSGSAVTAVNKGYNGTIGVGASVTFGFIATVSRTPSPPPKFQVDHVDCPQGSLPITPTPAPAG